MNRVVLVGNLTRDPELSTTSGGIAVCRLTVAVQRRFKNADGNYETDFIPVVAWRAQAENCNKYLRKGSKAGVCGSMQTRTYEAQDGTKRYVTEVIAEDVEFLTGKAEPGEKDEPPQKTKPAPKQTKLSDLMPIEDDDLPF